MQMSDAAQANHAMRHWAGSTMQYTIQGSDTSSRLYRLPISGNHVSVQKQCAHVMIVASKHFNETLRNTLGEILSELCMTTLAV